MAHRLDLATPQISVQRILAEAVKTEMEKIPISKFRVTCFATLERVRKTRRPVQITRFGMPIAEIVPPTVQSNNKNWIGSMACTVHIEGDIVAPASDEKDWEVLNS